MSMNVYISATREITFKKKDGSQGSGVQSEKFGAVQTPTSVTYKIVGSASPFQAYIEYVKSLSNIEQVPIYAKEDIFCEGDIVRYDEYDWAADHIAKFIEWQELMDSEGYTVTIEVI